MKLVTLRDAGRVAPGLLLPAERVLNLSTLLPTAHGPGLIELIAAGPAALDGLRALGGRAERGELKESVRALADVELLAPIPQPRKNVFCVGRNYKEHIDEAARARGNAPKVPEFPQYFTKPPTAVIGPFDDIPWDAAVTQKLDYEVELGVVIGRKGINISRERALDHVFGYTVINDITGRDLQRRHDQWFKGKGLDGSCPIGPWIVTADEVQDPQALDIWLTVNGERRQSSNTRMMIFDLREIISQLSQGLTLEPGDMIATGTPSGVGFAMDPPRLLGDGDMVVAEVQGVGRIANRVRRIEHRVAEA